VTHDDFAAFYRAVHNYEPFPWQTRLLRQVVECGWPAVLALPTAAGKTSAIDIAVFTLALQSGKSLAERTAPLRIFFVIDRRLVVDQAAGHALQLKEKLETSDANGIVRDVAEALRRLGGADPLHVCALRGGMYRDDSWAKAPNQPTVCVSTVDQVGSRLLFRGYGLSEYSWPVHAGLTGNDALYLLDEAHLSEPFLQTLRSVQMYREESPVGGPFRVVEISATPQSSEEPFTLAEVDYDNEELRRRLAAPKPARLVETVKFEKEAADLAVEARKDEAKVVGVVVNRVASAREIFRRLPGEAFEDKVLLTGRIRPWDRDELSSRCLERVRAGRVRRPEDKPLFVVATMTVEVGADLDFDHLITEAAPLSALRQRFGRLDRLGKFGKAEAVILLRKARGPDPIYGEDLGKAWEWLKEQGETIDFGVNALNARIQKSTSPPPVSTPRQAPALLPAHLDALVQTSPSPEPSPDVAPFLHGAEALDTADVQVIWRADLQPGGEKEWRDIVAAATPRSREALPLPVQAVRDWLLQGVPAEVADIEGVPGQGEQPTRGQPRPALLWRGPDAEQTDVIEPKQIQPGDTLVIPAEYGGADAFGWHPASTEPVQDVGDACVNEMANAAPQDGQRRLIRMRVYSVDEKVKAFSELLKQGNDDEDALQEFLDTLAARPSDPLAEAVIHEFARSKPRLSLYPAGVVLSARVRPGFYKPDGKKPCGAPEAIDDTTDTDDTSSVRAGTLRPVEVTLADHSDGVTRWATSFTERLGLHGELAEVIRQAAHLHDIGKADRRFQAMLYGDEPGDTLLAKSGREFDARWYKEVREHFGLPKGFRHELVSAALVRQHREQLLGELTDAQRDLVEYLVGTHHGRGRPFPPFIEDKTPEVVTLESGGQRLSASSAHRLWRLDEGWADCFWKLVRRYGYWGLAYLETLLRLADTTRSAEEPGPAGVFHGLRAVAPLKRQQSHVGRR
jgi:CRISPR-associated endonuclease/helicase Cas3